MELWPSCGVGGAKCTQVALGALTGDDGPCLSSFDLVKSDSGSCRKPSFVTLVMLNLIQRWLAGARSSTWDLSDYPPFELPHPGYGRALSEIQARQNLAYFQAALDERQRRLSGWLAAHGGPDARMLPGSVYAKALKIWARAHWVQLPSFARLPKHMPWPGCPRSGPFIVYSLLGDLGVSLGQAICHANPDWCWKLNMDGADLDDDMDTARRVVLQADLRHPTPETSQAVLDLEALVIAAYQFPESVDFVYLDTWSETVTSAIAGRYHNTSG